MGKGKALDANTAVSFDVGGYSGDYSSASLGFFGAGTPLVNGAFTSLDFLQNLVQYPPKKLRRQKKMRHFSNSCRT
jgi:hypothetical protein